MNKELEFAKKLALEAGSIMLAYFDSKDIELELKSDDTPVTKADKEINSLVINKVKQNFPEDGVLGEEESFNLEKNRLWIVDPLDGTSNFTRGVTLFAFSLALVENSQLKVGVIYDPLAKRLFWATDGGGAFLNDRPIKPLINDDMSTWIISSWTEGGVSGVTFKDFRAEERISKVYQEHGIRYWDLPVAQALAMVGGGYLEASITSCKNPWDVSAGALIARESGAKVTNIYGEEITEWHKDIKGVIAAAPSMHQQLLDILGPVIGSLKE